MGIEVGDIITAAMLDLMARPPAVRLIQQSAQSLANTTSTAITYGAGSEDIDSHDYHDETTSNTRITPDQSGLYKVNVLVATATSAIINTLDTWVAVNGTVIQPFSRMVCPQIAGIKTLMCTAIADLDGAGDYVEHFARQTQTSGALAVNTQATGGIQCVMEMWRIGDSS